MASFGKKLVVRHVIGYEILAFTLIIVLIWLDEIVDIPYHLLGAVKTVVNWEEALFETFLIVIIAGMIIYYTKILFDRMKYLEGFISICSSCKKIRDELGNWQQMEEYIHNRSEARFSHGLCPSCAQKLYPNVFTKGSSPENSTYPRNIDQEGHSQAKL